MHTGRIKAESGRVFGVAVHTYTLKERKDKEKTKYDRVAGPSAKELARKGDGRIRWELKRGALIIDRVRGGGDQLKKEKGRVRGSHSETLNQLPSLTLQELFKGGVGLRSHNSEMVQGVRNF